MNGPDYVTLALVLSAACLVAAAFVRGGSDKRRARRMMGIAALLGGVALLYLSVAGAAA